MGFSGLAHTTNGSLFYAVVGLLTQPHQRSSKTNHVSGVQKCQAPLGWFPAASREKGALTLQVFCFALIPTHLGLTCPNARC